MKPKKPSVTVWDHTGEVVKDSQWGPLTYRQWCDKEAERMNAAGASVHVVEKDGYVAICRS